MMARVISNYDKFSEECIASKICQDIGDIIIKTYFYTLYKAYIIECFNKFIVNFRLYLDSNDNLTVENKTLFLDKLSKIEKSYTKLEVYELKKLFKSLLDFKFISNLYINDLNLVFEYTLSS